jgi:YfiR/HmsC-like
MAVLGGAGSQFWRCRDRLRALAAMLLVCTVSMLAGVDAEASEYQIKAAFLYNFAKFVEWPPETFKDAGAPIHICVLGSSPVRWMLEDAVRNKNIDGRVLAVRAIAQVSEAGNCQILFVSASEQKHLRAILETTKSSDVLTVGETNSFTADGGVVGFSLDQGRIRFDINLQAAQLERLRISSKLLSLATSVRKAQ